MLSTKQSADLTVNKEVEVLVMGGGPAGTAAAFAAARQGRKTMIIEQFNCLGGIATAGGHGHMCLYTSWGNSKERVVGGIPWEIVERIVDAGFGVHNVANVDFEVEGLKLVMDRMSEENNINLLYYTLFSDVIVEDNRITGVVIQNKSGRSVIKAKQVIDCTGDGDVAAAAGCAYDQGDEETGHSQPVTLMFTIGGVDWQKVIEFRGEYMKSHPEDPQGWKLGAIYAEAQKNGDMRPFQSGNMGWWHTPTRPDQVGVNFTHVNFIDTTKAEDLTAATIEARKQAYETIDVYRKYIPGMENCYMVSTPNTVGTRESRRVRGQYTLTKEDLIAQEEFDDSIGYGSFFIDIHGTAGPGMDEKTYYPPKGFKYQIPYRIIVPQTIDNLFVAGRCASSTHEALGSLRVMPQCAVMGEAAGAGAALAIQDNTTAAQVDIPKLQAGIRKSGGIISSGDIVTYE